MLKKKIYQEIVDWKGIEMVIYLATNFPKERTPDLNQSKLRVFQGLLNMSLCYQFQVHIFYKGSKRMDPCLNQSKMWVGQGLLNIFLNYIFQWIFPVHQCTKCWQLWTPLCYQHHKNGSLSSLTQELSPYLAGEHNWLMIILDSPYRKYSLSHRPTLIIRPIVFCRVWNLSMKKSRS